MKTNELEKELDVAEDQLLQLKEILTDNSTEPEVDLIVAAEHLVHVNASLNGETENARNDAEERLSRVQYLESENKEMMKSLSLKEKKIQKIGLKRTGDYVYKMKHF